MPWVSFRAASQGVGYAGRLARGVSLGLCAMSIVSWRSAGPYWSAG